MPREIVIDPHALKRMEERGATEAEVRATVELGEQFAAKGAGPMQLSYNPRLNVAYIRLRPPGGLVETIRLSDEINIDMTPDGAVAGIELLNANEQLRASDSGELIVTDEADGRRFTVTLAAE
jgi:uncharacterized protein YuzE